MSNTFRKSKAKKIAAGLLGLSMFFTMGVGTASAALSQSQIDAIINLLVSFGADQATISNVQTALTGGTPASAPSSGATTGYTFTRDLKMGDTGEDVRQLQILLNSDPDTRIADSGVGSPGNETTYFGALTKAAVIKFQEKYASEVLAPVGLSAGTGYVGPSTRAKLNALSAASAPSTPSQGDQGSTSEDQSGAGDTATAPTGTELSVALASDTPISTALIQGQAIADLAHFTFTNPTSEDVTVTKVVLKRTGVSADTTLSNVYLFDGTTRLTDAATVSSGKITFDNTAGVFTIPAGTSKTIAVRSDIAGSTSGQIVGVALESVEASAPVAGTFPIAGEQHTIASASLATVSLSSSVTPSTNTSLDPQDDFVMWQNTATVGTRSVYLNSVAFRAIGSINSDDLQNFRLYVDGTEVASVASLDSDGYVRFDLSASPVELKTGSRTIKVVGNIVNGSGRDFFLSLRRASDLNVTDKDYGQNVLPTASGSFPVSAGKQTIASGTLTITKTADSPASNVRLNDNNVTLAKFELKAAGEPIKVENLTAQVLVNGIASSTVSLRNGALYANGVQVGSTATLESASSGTQYNFGSSLIVNPGSPVTLEVRADTYDNDGTNDLAANDTLKVRLLAGSSNAQRTSSLGYFNAPASNTAANQVTLVTGSMTLAKYSAYANQTAVVPQTAYKIGEFRLTSDDTEDVNLNTITLTIGGSGLSTSTDLTNIYVVYGPYTTSAKASGATSQSWSVSNTIPANTTWNVAVYADLASTINSGDTIIPTLQFSGTTASSGQSINTSSVTGQTITAGTGTFTVAADASKPATGLLVANTEQKVGAFKFTATNETYTVDQFGAQVPTYSDTVIQEVVFKDHSTGSVLASQPFNGRYATTSSGLGFTVPANSSKVVDVYLKLAGVGVGAATTGKNVNVTLHSYKVKNSTGSTTTAYPNVSGNAQYVVKSVPTVTGYTTTDKLAAGTKTIGKVTISADSAGPISWSELLFNYATSSGLSLSSITLWDGTTQVGGTATLQYSTSTIRFVPTSEQEIGAGESKTYTLKATIGGTITTGSYVQTSLAARSTSMGGPAAYTGGLAGAGGSLIWSDESASSHGLTTTDWFDDYKVPGIPTDSYSLNY